MILLYSIPVCSKSRTALDLLRDSGVPFEVRNYLKNPLSREELKDLLDRLGLPPSAIVRRKEPAAQAFEGTEPEEAQWLDWLVAHPECLQRPIARLKDKAWIVRPGEKIQEVIEAFRAESAS